MSTFLCSSHSFVLLVSSISMRENLMRLLFPSLCGILLHKTSSLLTSYHLLKASLTVLPSFYLPFSFLIFSACLFCFFTLVGLDNENNTRELAVCLGVCVSTLLRVYFSLDAASDLLCASCDRTDQATLEIQQAREYQRAATRRRYARDKRKPYTRI